MTILTVLGLACGLAWIGDRALLLSGPPGEAPRIEARLPIALLAGTVVLHLLALGLDAAGVSWTRTVLVGGLVVLAVGLSFAARKPSPTKDRLRPAPSDLLAFLTLVPFALFSVTGWSLAPDFVYHWGLKAHRFFLAGGIDWAWLASADLPGLHPDYPNLVPVLGAATATMRGIFRATAGSLWSVVWAVSLVALGRGWLRRDAASPALAGWGTVALASLVGFCAVAFRRGGDADWHLAVAILAGSWLLTAPRTVWTEAALGATAAFAAASKIEGLPFAAFLVGLALFSGGRKGLRVSSFLRLGAPTALVGIPWLLGIARHELFQPSNLGAPRFEEAPAIAEALLRSLIAPEWRGLGLVVAVLLPLLLSTRRLRIVAALVSLQLGFYLFAYLATPLDPALLVSTSFFRLSSHLVPTLVVGSLLAIDGFGPIRRPKE